MKYGITEDGQFFWTINEDLYNMLYGLNYEPVKKELYIEIGEAKVYTYYYENPDVLYPLVDRYVKGFTAFLRERGVL